jgi:hypothetical protein
MNKTLAKREKVDHFSGESRSGPTQYIAQEFTAKDEVKA